jgi:signal transduction histidine kinase
MSAWAAAVGRGNGSETATMAVAVGVSKAERCLVAYAAHKLRGEITLQRTLAEVALADPKADAAALREMGERVVAATERQARLLDALLTLARSECGRVRREPVDPR